MTQALADRLPENRKRLNAVVTKLTRTATGVTETLGTGDTLDASLAVLSMPPRIAANIAFNPSLPQDALTSMQNVPTWMAGQAKAIAVYDTPFWREDGLSGDAQSRFGPMVEIHDASPATGDPYALFGFIGVPPKGRTDEQTQRHHLTKQLIRLFGPKAGAPTQLYIKDWAIDPYTSTKADLAPLYAHPTYTMPTSLTHPFVFFRNRGRTRIWWLSRRGFGSQRKCNRNFGNLEQVPIMPTLDTKTALLNSAEDAARRLGFDGFSYADLAEDVGIRKASIHHHFPTKANLSVALMQRYHTNFQAICAELDASFETGGAQLAELIKQYKKGSDDGKRICLCASFSASRDSLSAEVVEEISLFRKMVIGWLTGAFEKGRTDGTISGVTHPAYEAASMMSLLEGAQLAARAEENPALFGNATALLMARISA